MLNSTFQSIVASIYLKYIFQAAGDISFLDLPYRGEWQFFRIKIAGTWGLIYPGTDLFPVQDSIINVIPAGRQFRLW